MITSSTTTSKPPWRKTSATASAPAYRRSRWRSSSAPASGRMSARPLTTISLMVSPGTQTPCSNRPASSRATVDFPAAEMPEITNSATPPIMSGGRVGGELPGDDALVGLAVGGAGREPDDGRPHDGRVEPGGLHLVRRVVRGHAGAGRAPGEQQVHVDAGTGQVGRHDVGERLGGGAGRAVRGETAAPHGGVADRDVDDLAVSGAEQVRDDGLGDQEVADDVRLEQVAEAVRADLPEGGRVGHEARVDRTHADPGVVDQNVDAAEDAQSLVDAGG